MTTPAKATDIIKAEINWKAIGLEYRTGMRTLRAIGETHGVSHTAINKKAKKEGWVRDLQKKIKARAQELVTKAMVSSEVSKDGLVTERREVEAAGTVLANVLLRQQTNATRSMALAMSMLAELEAQTNDPDLFTKLGDILAKPSDDAAVDKLQDIFNKVISLPGRVDSMKKLAETLRILIALERQAFRMDEEAPDTSRLPEDLSNLSTADLRKFAVSNSRKLFGAAFVMMEEVNG